MAFAYLAVECLDKFTWELNILRELLLTNNLLLRLCLMSTDFAPMNAIKVVNTPALNLLCLFHISKNMYISACSYIDGYDHVVKQYIYVMSRTCLHMLPVL